MEDDGERQSASAAIRELQSEMPHVWYLNLGQLCRLAVLERFGVNIKGNSVCTLSVK